MIYKSYLVEENISILKHNLTLFYGENSGLINDFKKDIYLKEKNNLIIKLTQEEIIYDKSVLFTQLQNSSLFEDKKIIFINNASDKLFPIIKDILSEIKDNKLFLFSEALEKRSKLRIFFEKEKNVNLIPCYNDNLLTLKNIVTKRLKDFKSINPDVVNVIIENSNSDRTKLNNEIEKIKTYFLNKTINLEELIKLLNIKENDNFNNVKDQALIGNSKNTNNLLSNTVIEDEKIIFYLNIINQRLIKIREIYMSKEKNLEKAVSGLKPPIFWKDKAIFMQQVGNWEEKKINKAINMTYEIETTLKSKANINKQIILKKLIVDMCNLANAA